MSCAKLLFNPPEVGYDIRRVLIKFSLLSFLEFVLGYSKALTSATEQHLNICVCSL